MENINEIIKAFGGADELAKVLNLTPVAIYSMSRRESIPAEHWTTLIAEASERGIDITYELLAQLRASKRKQNVEV